MADIQFYYDYLSPYAYLAHTQLRPVKAAVDYRPFDIRKLMPEVGNVPTSVICKPKNRYIQADLQRWVARYGTPFRRNPQIQELDSRRLLRATLWAGSRGQAEIAATALFAAMWGEPRPLRTAAEVAAVLRQAGVDDGGATEAEIDDPAWDAALTQATSEAAGRGVFGAPTMFVGDDMFFGNDRLDFVRAALGRAP